MTREDVDMFFVNEGRPFAIKQTQDLILGLRLVEDDGPVHIKIVVKGEYQTMEGEESVALDEFLNALQLQRYARQLKQEDVGVTDPRDFDYFDESDWNKLRFMQPFHL
ncbi:unnamed protein product, partial [Heterosigma akashiwo]